MGVGSGVGGGPQPGARAGDDSGALDGCCRDTGGSPGGVVTVAYVTGPYAKGVLSTRAGASDHLELTAVPKDVVG